MAPIIEDNREALIALCKRHHVKRLDVFGSAATGAFEPDRSDVDLLVEFDLERVASASQTYLDFLDAVTRLLGSDVDIVNPKYIRNRYFRAGVEDTRREFYDRQAA